MSHAEPEPRPTPLARDDAGRLMAAGTRISLDVVVAGLKADETPESIRDSYRQLSLADVCSIRDYYLHNCAEVEAYLAQQEREAAEIRAQVEAANPSEGLRVELLSRLRS